IGIDILSWEDLGPAGNGPSTATDNVLLLDQDFYIPQLDRSRRIWIYLPPDYQNTNKTYPVLYLQDGQNVFDAFTSFSGEWEVDESLNQLFDLGDEGAIVVAIANGGAERINEYSPWVNPNYGGGEGALYVDFIVNTLKPYIDNNYRSRPEREYTGIVGSSMGGLIAMYAAIEHQEVFGKAGVFSPSFWFTDQAYNHVSNTGKEADTRIYLLAGDLESNGSVVAAIEAMYSTLIAAGFDAAEVNVHTHADGQHSEWFWAREFPDAYLWLCADPTTSTTTNNSTWKVSVFPNPAGELLYIHFQEPLLDNMSYQLYTTSGYKLLDRKINNRNIHIATNYLSSGTYWLNFLYQGKVRQTEKVIINK
ncbi:MAG: alpha/beta hydrolase-fold protein, partial [Bacteroidota bacterium]